MCAAAIARSTRLPTSGISFGMFHVTSGRSPFIIRGRGGRGVGEGKKGITLGILLIDCSRVQGVSVQSIIIIVYT